MKTSLEGKLMHLQTDIVQVRAQVDRLLAEEESDVEQEATRHTVEGKTVAGGAAVRGEGLPDGEPQPTDEGSEGAV
jgi:hypothetical protein